MKNGQKRIVSLLPGLTDTVLALGAGSQLVGVSHECDLPEGWDPLPRLTRSRIPEEFTSQEVDQAVSSHSGTDLFELDIELLRELKPDVILTQSLCDVCAVSESTVAQAVSAFSSQPSIHGFHSTNLSRVFSMIRDVGELLGRRRQAESVIRQFETTEQELERNRSGKAVIPAVHLEWLDPVMGSGHWNPDLFRIAGAQERTALPGEPSRVLSRQRFNESMKSAEVVVLGVCGFRVERIVQELLGLDEEHPLRSHIRGTGKRVFAMDGHRCLVRPGPLLLTSLVLLADLFHGKEARKKTGQIGDLNLDSKPSDLAELIEVEENWSLRLLG